jgi:hypothetical protein
LEKVIFWDDRDRDIQWLRDIHRAQGHTQGSGTYTGLRDIHSAQGHTQSSGTYTGLRDIHRAQGHTQSSGTYTELRDIHRAGGNTNHLKVERRLISKFNYKFR